jgi:hypothetical protein
MSALKRFAQSYLLDRRITLGRTSEAVDIAAFLATIRPVETERPLIRVGGDGDGGYLVPDDFAGITACFSPGVSTIADFETELARRGIKCFLADASIEVAPFSGDMFDFERKFLGVKGGGSFITLEDWVRRKAPDASDLIPQMDIEGAEYRVVLSTKQEILRRFRIMVIEFHHLACIYDRIGLDLVSLTFSKLLQDFEIVHIHPNNRIRPIAFNTFETPPLIEFTFLRRDRVTSRRSVSSFPHPLDRKNVAARPDVDLPACWYR